MTLSRADFLTTSCAKCAMCANSRYQAPPALYAGPFDAPVLVVAQNPGEIKEKHRLELADAAHIEAASRADPNVIRFWYDYDFKTSNGFRSLASIFGPDWLSTGQYVFTNSVRCRTKGNEAPSTEMVDSCASWTRQLVDGRKAVIVVGAVARGQLLGAEAEKLPWGTPRKKGSVIYLAVKHYSAWGGASEAREYEAAVKRVLEALK